MKQGGRWIPGNPDDFESMSTLHRLVLPQGTCIGMHKHVNSEEFHYIEKGNAVMIADGKRNPYATSQCFYDKSGKRNILFELLNCETEDVALVMEVDLDNKQNGERYGEKRY